MISRCQKRCENFLRLLIDACCLFTVQLQWENSHFVTDKVSPDSYDLIIELELSFKDKNCGEI